MTIENKSIGVDPVFKRYCLSYNEATVVVAAEETVGIFCYRYKKQANGFRNYLGKSWTKVIKVEPLGEMTKPSRICRVTTPYYIRELIKDKSKEEYFTIPDPDTECYRAVKVIGIEYE